MSSVDLPTTPEVDGSVTLPPADEEDEPKCLPGPQGPTGEHGPRGLPGFRGRKGNRGARGKNTLVLCFLTQTFFSPGLYTADSFFIFVFKNMVIVIYVFYICLTFNKK